MATCCEVLSVETAPYTIRAETFLSFLLLQQFTIFRNRDGSKLGHFG